jgi:hypothetical protein
MAGLTKEKMTERLSWQPGNFIGYDADGRIFTPPELVGLTAEEIATPNALRVALKRGRQRLAR